MVTATLKEPSATVLSFLAGAALKHCTVFSFASLPTPIPKGARKRPRFPLHAPMKTILEYLAITAITAIFVTASLASLAYLTDSMTAQAKRTIYLQP